MAGRPALSEPIRDELDSHTVALRIVAGLLIAGAAYLMGVFILTFLLGVILSIALSPVATWLEARGVPRTLSSLLCMSSVAAVLAVTGGLFIYQAGTIVQDADTYLQRFGELIADASNRAGGDQLMRSLGLLGEESQPRNSAPGQSQSAGGGEVPPSEHEKPGGERLDRQASRSSSSGKDGLASGSIEYWTQFLRTNIRDILRWTGRGLGGLLGLVVGIVVLLSYIFYMLQTRGEWVERITRSTARLGLRPRQDQLGQVQSEIVTFLGCLSLVSVGYTIIVTLILWLIGVPQPLLWGIMTGLLEWIPYFGPLIAMILPTIVAMSLGTWWQPAAVFTQFLVLHTLEGYVITPLLYGSAVKIDPVTVLVGVLFFGWLWGPLGLAVAMPTLILLRGLLLMSPDTPALDALAATDEAKEDDRSGPSLGSSSAGHRPEGRS